MLVFMLMANVFVGFIFIVLVFALCWMAILKVLLFNCLRSPYYGNPCRKLRFREIQEHIFKKRKRGDVEVAQCT